MLSVALPRLKTKRRRWKPPRPQFWWALFWTAYWVVWMVVAALMFMGAWGPQNLIGRALVVPCAVYVIGWAFPKAWKRFLNEWHLWRRDDD